MHSIVRSEQMFLLPMIILSISDWETKKSKIFSWLNDVDYTNEHGPYYTDFDQQIQYEYMLIIFLMTFFGYNIQMISNPVPSDGRRNQTNWLMRYGQKIKYLSYFLFIISIPVVIVTFSFEVLIFSLPAFIAVIMYKSNNYTSFGLRTIPSLKLILIAMIWSWVCVITPQLLNYSKFSITRNNF